MSRLYNRSRILLTDSLNRSRTIVSTAERKPFASIPGPKPLPLIGNIWRYFPIIGPYKVDALFENAQYNKDRYGPIVREQLTNNHTILHLFDPDDIESFFRQDSKYPHRRSHRALLKYRRDRPDLYNDGGLFPENGESWYRQRKLFDRHLMSKSKLSKLILNIDDMSLKTICSIKKSHKLEEGLFLVDEFGRLLYRLALGNTLTTFLNVNIDSIEAATVDEMMLQLHNSLTAIERTEVYTDRWIENPDNCQHYGMLVESQEFLYSFVSRIVEASLHEPPNEENPSFLEEWLHKDKLDKLDVISFIIDSLMAGFHTTSYTLAFLIYHISKNSDIQDSLRNEVATHLPKDKPMTMDNLDKLLLMRNCLKETLRLNPVSIGTGRVTCDEMTIRDYTIPTGTMVIAHNQVMSNDESIFKDARIFNPERWVTYRNCPDERPSPFARLPFGFGARSCLGQRIAELQIKLFITRLLQEFSLPDNQAKIPTRTTLIHVIEDYYKVSLRERNQKGNIRVSYDYF